MIADLEAECEQLARKRGVVWSRRVVGDPFRDKVDFRNFKLRETNSKFTADARKEAELADRDFNDRMVCDMRVTVCSCVRRRWCRALIQLPRQLCHSHSRHFYIIC